MKSIITLAMSVTAILVCSLGGMAADAARLKAAPTNACVGAFYFPGWSTEERWYCIKANKQVQHPQIGYYREGSPQVADWQIKQAAEHGISFFAFDYYSNNGSEWMESALDDGFLKSKYIGQFKFCLNWCNELADADELQQLGDIIIEKYLKHPSYLKVDGKPVLMLLAGSNFAAQLGVEAAKKQFRELDQHCKNAGLKGIYLMFGDGGVANAQAVTDGFASGADGYFVYNYPYAGVAGAGPGVHQVASYQHLVEQADGLMKYWSGITQGRFWPTVMAGWDRRPWTKQADLRRIGNTADLFEKSLRSISTMLNPQRILMIEAWNEWGEGSVIEPSAELGCSYLDRVHKVFSRGSVPHSSQDVKRMQASAPQFDVKLPSQDTWRFDHDAMGFLPSGLSAVQTRGGVMSGTSTTGDPQFLSPLCYLKCSDYTAVQIRLRAASPSKDIQFSDGEFYWSTIDADMNATTWLAFKVSLDGQWHTYRIDLKGNPQWKGLTDRFRVDPCNTPGVNVDIDNITFVKK